MKHLLQQSRLNHLIKQRNGYLILASGLLIICLVLASLCFSLSHRERIILIPPQVERSFWVSSQSVSPEYISEMTLFFSYLRLNATPESIDSQRQLLLRYIDPHYFGTLNDTLVAERDRITTQHISTAFYPVTIQVNAKSFSAVIVGDLISSIGTTQLPPQRVSYRLDYKYEQGRLLVNQFIEVKPHE